MLTQILLNLLSYCEPHISEEMIFSTSDNFSEILASNRLRINIHNPLKTIICHFVVDISSGEILTQKLISRDLETGAMEMRDLNYLN